MPKKSKRKKKKKQRKDKPKPPPEPIPPPPPQALPISPNGVGQKRDGYTWALTKKIGRILGVSLSLLALIEVYPRLSASATPPLDLGNQLASSRFTVTNDGHLPITEVMSACFMWHVTEGGYTGTSSLARVVAPPESRLRPAESYTVPCTTEGMIGTNPPYRLPLRQADVAIVAYYRVWPLTIWRDHKLFRFVARIAQDGSVAWDKQPVPDEMERDYDNLILSHGGSFPPSTPQFHFK